MADQGASQRRGTDSAGSPISQANTLYPNDAAGQYYYSPAGGTLMSNDMAAYAPRRYEDLQTKIGVDLKETNTQGTSYVNPNFASKDDQEHYIAVRRISADRSPLNVATPETSAHGTYLQGSMTATPIGGISLTTTFKLRARDSGAGPIAYVEWSTTSTPLSVGSYSGVMPNGGPLVELTVLSIVTR
jgi:hypothetical protein